MVDFGKSDNMIKISGKLVKSNSYNGFSSNISFFIHGRTSSDKNYFQFFNQYLSDDYSFFFYFGIPL